MNGLMKRIWEKMMMRAPLLSTAPPKTADGDLSLSELFQGSGGRSGAGSPVIAPSDRKIGGKPAGERISWFNPDGTKRDIPIYANGDTPVDRALHDLDTPAGYVPVEAVAASLTSGSRQAVVTPRTREFSVDIEDAGHPDVVMFNGVRFIPDAIPGGSFHLKSSFSMQSRELNVAMGSDLGLPDVVMVNRTKFFADAPIETGGRAANLANVNALRVALAQRVTSMEEEGGRTRSSTTIRKASDMLGYLSRELVAQDRRLFEVKAHLDKAISDGDGDVALIGQLTAERDAAVGARDAMQRHLADMTTNRDALDEACQRKDKRIGELTAELETARAQVVALSQPRVINVAGLVDADLAERYQSLQESFDLVNGELTKLRRPVSGVSVYREIDALGGTTDLGDYSAGYREALDEVIAILEQRGFTEHADPAPVYSDGDREKAAQAFHDDPLAARDHAFEPGTPRGDWCFEVVDCVAGSLGMRRAGA